MRLTGFVFALFLSGIAPVLAQDAQSGHRLATMWCSACHQVENSTSGISRDTPPSFAAVARMHSTTSMALTVFLSTPHAAMPNFSLSRKEIADVSAYILSLRPPHQGG